MNASSFLSLERARSRPPARLCTWMKKQMPRVPERAEIVGRRAGKGFKGSMSVVSSRLDPESAWSGQASIVRSVQALAARLDAALRVRRDLELFRPSIADAQQFRRASSWGGGEFSFSGRRATVAAFLFALAVRIGASFVGRGERPSAVASLGVFRSGARRRPGRSRSRYTKVRPLPRSQPPESSTRTWNFRARPAWTSAWSFDVNEQNSEDSFSYRPQFLFAASSGAAHNFYGPRRCARAS